MPMRLSGMYSGLDTESIIQELVKAKSAKTEKLKKEKTKLEWKQEIWKDLNTKTKSFFDGALSNLRWTSSYKKKNTSVSNTTAVSVITGESAMNGVQKLSVDHLAKTGYLTGDKLKTVSGDKATGETLISDLRFKKNTEGAETSGIPALSGEGSFTVTVNGTSKDININSETTIEQVVTQLRNAGVEANFDETNQRIFIASTASGKDYDFAITANNAVGFSALTVLGINEDLADAQNTKTLDGYTNFASMYAQVSGMTNEEAVEFITSDVNSDFYKALKAEVTNEEEPDYDAAYAKLLEKLQFADEIVNGSSFTSDMFSSSAVRIAGEDCTITLNEVSYTSNTNNVEVNGLTITCNSLATDITVTTQDDTDGIYDMVRDFFKGYNELINEMDKLYNAATANKFEPLTDEEKDEMSEKEVEKWEQKIKDSLLRSDSSLSSVASAMKVAMMKSYKVDGKEYNLSSFGIETLSYFLAPENQKNAYHIDGDDKDALVSGKADKLKGMIATDSETVVSFFTQLSREVYSKLDGLSKSTDYQSGGSFYEDKKYKNDLNDYESRIKEAEARVADYEDKYYKKFSNMEVALSKLQSSTNSLISMLGGGNNN